MKHLRPRSPASTLATVSLALPKAYEKFLGACSDFIATQVEPSQRGVAFSQVVYYRDAVNSLLDTYLEHLRREQEHEVEMWWCLSWPCTAPPEWPEDQNEESAA